MSSLSIFSHFLPDATEQGAGTGGRRDLKSIPFISYLSGLQKSQLLSDDMVNGVEIRCEEKGSCQAGCHLCHHQAIPSGGGGGGVAGLSGRGRGGDKKSGEQPSPTPVLLEVTRVVPLYSLVQDNVTREVRVKPGNRKLRVHACRWTWGGQARAPNDEGWVISLIKKERKTCRNFLLFYFQKFKTN